ncbi:hypothetical protein [Hymenobacter sp. CRA2]|uniref:hypothetical protein n=1 Tax=Hymenobacter sp. CRA2 TaxID=1955620 RepID=UPI00158FA0AB|nr:hypothetical protein [Hymenobacter sp. CRA2]
MAASRPSANLVWFALGIVFLSLGIAKRRSRAFIGTGVAFIAIGIIRTRKQDQPPVT